MPEIAYPENALSGPNQSGAPSIGLDPVEGVRLLLKLF
jgi:hypothetical protein